MNVIKSSVAKFRRRLSFVLLNFPGAAGEALVKGVSSSHYFGGVPIKRKISQTGAFL